jgi:hypothetical protein
MVVEVELSDVTQHTETLLLSWLLPALNARKDLKMGMGYLISSPGIINLLEAATSSQ